MTRERDNAKAALLDLMRSWDEERAVGAPVEAGTVASPSTFAEWLRRAQRDGLTRRDVHAMIWDIFRAYDGKFTADTMDVLGEIDTALTGFCHPASVIRFPGDPEDADALSGYVLRNEWR